MLNGVDLPELGSDRIAGAWGRRCSDDSRDQSPVICQTWRPASRSREKARFNYWSREDQEDLEEDLFLLVDVSFSI